MKKSVTLLFAVVALSLSGVAAAALVPGVFDPGATGCPVATYTAGVLHLEKNCPDATNAAAGADITGFTGQTFVSSSFTLANQAQCQGGSPRFDVVTADGTFFLGCNNVTPTLNGDGTATYTFDAASIAGGGQPFPTGAISAVDVLIDIQGTADLTHIVFNGVTQVPAPTTGGAPTAKADCKKGGWKSFTTPAFKNQGQCVAYVNHHSGHGKGKDGGTTTTTTTTTAASSQPTAPSSHGKSQGKGKHGK